MKDTQSSWWLKMFLSSHYISKINENPNLNVIVILGPMRTCLLQEWDHTLNRLIEYESGPWWLLSPSFWFLKTCKPGSRELNNFFWLSANFLVGTEIIHSGSEHKILTQVYVQVKNIILSSVQFSSVAQSCPTLCNPMNCSTPGLPVHHQLPEFTQTHVHRVTDAIQPSHPRSSPSPPAPSSLTCI